MDLLLMISIHVWMCAYSTTSTLFGVSLLYDFYMCCTYNIFGKIWILIPYGILYYVFFCPFTNSFYECILCIILMALQWIVTENLHDITWMKIDHYEGKSAFPTNKNTSACGCIFVKCAYSVETSADISCRQSNILWYLSILVIF